MRGIRGRFGGEEWRSVAFGDFAEVQPKVALEKGVAYSFIEMAEVEPHIKFVHPNNTRIWSGSGGAKFQDGDVLFARITPCLEHGKTVKVGCLTDARGFGSSEFFVFRGREDISNPDFIYYLSRSPAIREPAIKSMIGASGRQRAQKTVVENTIVHVPRIDEQRHIASVLSAYDNLIDNNRQRIKLLEQAAQLLYKEWFVRFRFPGHEHTAVTNGVPEGWKLCGMLDHPHFELIGENIGAFDGVKRYYATADITGIDITGDGIDYTFEAKPSRASKAPEVGSVWFARMQETHKVLAFTETNRPMAENSILSSGFAGFRVRRAEFLPWLFLLINNARFHEEKDLYCTGATQRSLTNGGLKRIQVIAPPESVVGDFADLAGPIIEQVLTIQALNRQLAQARDLLLPRLMSGRVAL